MITFVLTFEDNENRISCKRYFLPTMEIKDCSVITEEQNLIDQSIRNDSRIYGNIQKIATGQGDYY